MSFRADPTTLVGTAGFFATLTLAEINSLVSVLVGVATLGFMVTKWLLLVRSRGGFQAVFCPTPAPTVLREDNKPTNPPAPP